MVGVGRIVFTSILVLILIFSASTTLFPVKQVSASTTLTGTWTGTLQRTAFNIPSNGQLVTCNVQGAVTLTLEQNGNSITGKFSTSGSSVTSGPCLGSDEIVINSITGTVTGSQFTFSGREPPENEDHIEMTAQGSFTDNSIQANFKFCDYTANPCESWVYSTGSFNANNKQLGIRSGCDQPPHANIKFGPNAHSDGFSDYSRRVLEDIFHKAGVDGVTISSTYRTSEDQARIMFENLRNNQSPKYGQAGLQVINVYNDMKAQQKNDPSITDGDIIQAMKDKIDSVGLEHVTHHNFKEGRNTVDIAPSSVKNRIALHFALEEAEKDGIISKYIPPNIITKDNIIVATGSGDPAFHIEILQKGSQGNQVPSTGSDCKKTENILTEQSHEGIIGANTFYLPIVSSSTITDFTFSEQNKQISFRVSGADGTEGTTIIQVSQVLVGPYTVMFDGAVMANFETMSSEAGETSIKLTYKHSTHNITITGASVVPEFPVAVMAVMGMIVAIAIAINRLKKVAHRQFYFR